MAIDFEFLEEFDRKQVMIVDDDAFMLGVLEKLLNLLGIERVLRAENGQQARSLLDGHAVDLVITDVQMPELDGLSLLKLIRTNQTAAAHNLPVIVVTSLEDEKTLAQALSLDVNGFVQKPFKAPLLIKRALVAMSEAFHEAPGFPYREVVIDPEGLVIEGGAVRSKTSHDQQRIPRERSERLTVVSLFQLRPDMQLAEDIKTKTGTVLLSRGFTLNEARVHRMWELEDNLEKTSFKIIGGWS
jgi:CheY-like chemotaxis protein